MTYYKYVSREGADVVDWGAITKSVSESLGQVAKDREAKRESIADASRQYGETLSNAPMGESKTINDFTIEYANNAEKYRLMQDRLLRSGQMSLKDYNLGRANLTSGTTDLFNLSKEYNAVYADKMERMNKKDSSLAESWAMGNIEGYSNFSKSSAYIDPTNGRVAVGMKVKKTLPDGKEVFELSENPNDLKSVNELKNIINTKYDRFKIAQNLQPEVDKLSKTIEVLMEDGVKTREDARLNENYLDSRNTFINSFIETKPDIPMSVLVDYLGVVPDEKGEPTDVSFEFTYDPDEAATSDKFILMEPNKDTGRYEANLTKSQKEMARKALTAKFESMVDKVDTARQEFAPQRPTTTDKAYARTLRKNADLARDITDVLTNPNAQDVQAGLGILREYGLNIRGSAKTPTGLNFEVYNKNTKKYEDVPVIIDKEDTRGSVERVLQKLLGRDVDVNEVMNQLPDNFFEGKSITEIEALFAPEEVVEIKEVDSRQNVMMDPLQEDLTQPKPVTVDSQIKKLEDGTIDEQEEVTTVLSEVLKQQGIDDVDVQFTTKRTGSGRRGRQVTTVDINSKYFEQPYKVLLSEFENEIRTIIQDITNKRKSQMTFGGEPTVQGNETAPQTGNVDAFGNPIE